jgi:hypothetical protein
VVELGVPSDFLRRDFWSNRADLMNDIWSKAKRSEVMSRIRGKGNKSTELKLLNLFREHRITGWRRHQPLPASPTLFSPRNDCLYLWTAVSGTAGPNATSSQNRTPNSGGTKLVETKSAIKGSPGSLGGMVGVYAESGNAA